MSEEKKRTVLSPAERVAKLEAELEAARKKAEEKAGKRATQLKEQRAKLVAKRDEAQGKIDDIDAELDGLGLGTDVEESPAEEQPTLPEDDES